MTRKLVYAMAAAAVGAWALAASPLVAQDAAAPAPPATAPATRPVQAKPLSDNVKKGLAWLVEHQQENGAWAQGEESAAMGNGMASIKDTPSVAETCMATMALLRSGSSPSSGDYAPNIRKGLDFICSEVDKADSTSLYVTSVRGSRVQSKLGQYIDTFAAALVLAEVRNEMPDEPSRKRVIAALDKVMDKIEKNQKADGTWASDGWAPALAQGMASKALNTASVNGVAVNEEVRERAEKYAQGQFDSRSGGVDAGGSAGVELYARSSNLSALQESANANHSLKQQAQQVLSQPAATTAPAQRAAAEATLKRVEENEKELAAAQDAVVARMGDKQFIAGFGSNGGEEFLSYLNIGESLVLKGGEAWDKWDKSTTENLNRIQNADGSWAGQHCITGRTFCTSAALMVLTIDRAQKSISDQIKRR